MKVAVVTGADGFIGRHLCRYLIGMDYEVRGISRSVLPPKVHRVDVRLDDRVSQLARIFEDVDEIYQLAGATPSHRRHSSSDFHQANVVLPKRVLMASDLAGVPKIVYSSSINVLGKTSYGNPFRTTDPYKPYDEYTRSKVFAEQELLDFPAENTDVLVVRCPLVYGSEVKGNMLLLMKWLAAGLPSPPFSANATRSLIGVRNLCHMMAQIDVECSGIFHIADPEDISLGQLIEYLCKEFGRKQPSRFLSNELANRGARFFGLHKRYPALFETLAIDREEMFSKFKWNPPFSGEDELRIMTKWFLQTK
ncbi:MAG: hypothetical protein CMD74_02630 [Gammaproteobacteria bacterium]|nr:hypothetical protein [Gammaproteobacteria bacterium]